ncbi:MAG: hypothetical protein ABJA81_04025 [Nocardioidaceae bacterium]
MACSLKDRHLVGAGAAPCAVCCATPLLTYLGVAGVMATVATVVFTAGTEVPDHRASAHPGTEGAGEGDKIFGVNPESIPVVVVASSGV